MQNHYEIKSKSLMVVSSCLIVVGQLGCLETQEGIVGRVLEVLTLGFNCDWIGM